MYILGGGWVVVDGGGCILGGGGGWWWVVVGRGTVYNSPLEAPICLSRSSGKKMPARFTVTNNITVAKRVLINKKEEKLFIKGVMELE